MVAPIMSLPPEIFAEIFGGVARDAHDAYIRSLRHEPLPEDPDLPRPYSWILLTHVCRVWRWIALSTPALWADLSIIDADATEELLARSGNHNLTLTFRLPENRRDRSLDDRQISDRMDVYALILQDEFHRITSLTVPAILELFRPTVGAATQLRSIVMISPNFGFETSDSDVEPFAFPALERLEYRAAGHRPYHRLFCSTLKTLILRPIWETADDEDEVYLPSAREMVRALARMPSLQVLDVHISDEIQTITHTADVPNLRLMRVIGATAAVTCLLRHTAAPRDVQLHLDCRLPDDGESFAVVPVPYIISEALASQASSSYAPCSAFSIKDTKGYYEMRGWRRAQDRDKPDAADVVVDCPWLDDYDNLGVLLRPFTLRDVQHVRIGSMPWDLDGTPEALGTLCAGQNIQSLVIDGLKVTHALELVGRTSAKAISLLNINFKPSDPVKEAQWLYNWSSAAHSVSSDDPTSVADLADVFEQRAKDDRPLLHLTIANARNVVAADVETLKDNVAVLEWDGVEIDDLDPADEE